MAIISFDKQVFEEPLIGTCITILEKCHDKDERDSNLVKFLRIKEYMETDKIVDIIKSESPAETLYEESSFRLVTKEQKQLVSEEKWERFLIAPKIYFEILNNKKMTLLKNVAEVSRGLTTGANDFFYFRGEKHIKELGIDKKFITPLIKHISQTDYIKLTRKDTDWYVLDVHDIVDEILSDYEKTLMAQRTPVDIIKAGLKEKGYNNLLSYILLGEARTIHKISTVKNRKIWFDLGVLDQPPIMFSEVYWRNPNVLFNIGKLALDKRLYSIKSKKNINKKVLLGILNSSLTVLMREMHGRTEQGEAMNRNTIMVYETENLPIPDPRTFSDEECNDIVSAFEELIKNERKNTEKELRKFRRKINEAVLSTIGIESRVVELEKTVDQLLQLREKGGSQRTEPLVGEKEKYMLKLSGAILQDSKSFYKKTLKDF